MIVFTCLVVKKYRGITITKQKEIVQSLGGTIASESGILWDIQAQDIEQVKKVEQGLVNKVPYYKTVE